VDVEEEDELNDISNNNEEEDYNGADERSYKNFGKGSKLAQADSDEFAEDPFDDSLGISEVGKDFELEIFDNEESDKDSYKLENLNNINNPEKGDSGEEYHESFSDHNDHDEQS